MIQQQGRLLGIALRSRSRAAMEEVETAVITKDNGVLKDSRGAAGPRQVTLLAAESWDRTCEALGKVLPWTDRRANLLVEGIRLEQSTGSVIHVGDVTLEVTGETDPCSRMDEIETGLRAALTPEWRGGVCCRVLVGGTLSKGAPIRMESPSESA